MLHPFFFVCPRRILRRRGGKIIEISMLKDGERAERLLGDKIIIQSERFYRFTSDSILLSRFARAKAGDKVADFCSGCGVVGLHFLCLNPRISSLDLFEMQPELADMSLRSAQADGFSCVSVHNCLVQDIGREYDGAFSLILCNPPYESSGFESPRADLAACRKEITLTLEEIVRVSAQKLKFGGRFTLCHRADRCAELIYLLKCARMEPKRLQLVSGSPGARPYLVMIEAVKGGKAGVCVLPELLNKNVTSFSVDI